MANIEQFAAVLRRVMAEREIRVAEFARRVGKSDAAIAKWRGGGAWPRTRDMKRVVLALGLSVDDPAALELFEARGVEEPPVEVEIPDFVQEAFSRASDRLRTLYHKEFCKLLAEEILNGGM